MFDQISGDAVKEMVCLKCGNRGQMDYQVEGSFIVELLLWLLFFIPGLIYTANRIANARMACPVCRGIDLIPVTSPKAKELIEAGKTSRGPSGDHGKDYLIRMAIVNGAVALAFWGIIWYILSLRTA